MDYINQQKHDDLAWKKNKQGWKTTIPDKWVTDLISKVKKGRMLDLGCGEGRHAIFFAKKGFSAYGVDYSKEALKKAKMNSKKVNFKHANIFNLSYENDFFDLIVDVGLLHHIKKKDWNKYLKNVIRVLKPGGYYFCSQFSKNSSSIRGILVSKLKRNWNIVGNFYDHFFTKKEYKDLFSKKFKIIKISENIGSKKSIKLIHFFGKLK